MHTYKPVSLAYGCCWLPPDCGAFQVQPKLPENFEDSTWDRLQRAVGAIQTKQPIATSREELYRAVEDLCVHKMGAKLYER